MTLERQRLWAGLAAMLALVAGCGPNAPPRAPAKGVVTFAGTDLKSGSILFIPVGDTRGPKAGGPIENGRFELTAEDGPGVGRLRVEIRANDELPYSLDDPQQFAAQPDPLPPPNRIPPRYNANSELFVDTTPEGPNEFKFDLLDRAAP